MNVEGLTELESPVFVHSEKLRELEAQLYGHVLGAIDLDALAGFEQHLYELLSRELELSDELALDLSTQILESAIRRVAEDSRRYLSFGPPGISDAERAAVAFDEACPFCVDARRAALVSAARARCGASEPHDDGQADDEPCPCCEMEAQRWREEHATVLAKAGLSRPSSTSAMSSTSAIAGVIEIAKRDRARRSKPS